MTRQGKSHTVIIYYSTYSGILVIEKKSFQGEIGKIVKNVKKNLFLEILQTEFCFYLFRKFSVVFCC